jgi:23S rRNA (uridine2552-2'-O)-methyltransferase
LALAFAQDRLGPEGAFLLKTFQGEGFEALYRVIRQSFARVRLIKPPASRGRSREVYIVAKWPRRRSDNSVG